MIKLFSNQTYVIIPGYNEAKYLGSVLKKVSAQTDFKKGLKKTINWFKKHRGDL